MFCFEYRSAEWREWVLGVRWQEGTQPRGFINIYIHKPCLFSPHLHSGHKVDECMYALVMMETKCWQLLQNMYLSS